MTPRIQIALLTAFLLLAGCWRARSQPEESTYAANNFASAEFVVTEADRMAARDLWPGFLVTNTPIAIFDGSHTWLFRHPSPPDSFTRVPDNSHSYVYRGRYAAVSANSSATIGGIMTATLMPPAANSTSRARVGVLTHELFHVFQRARHPVWSANEAELFTYPTDNVELLAQQRVETLALRRAVNAPGRDSAACWTRAALDARAQRFASMTAGATLYERNTELNEGLATYVEYRAMNVPNSRILPTAPFAPDAVRLRGYQTGVALARLLDQFLPAWRDSLELRDSTSLDVLLGTTMNHVHLAKTGAPRCAISPSERQTVHDAATADVAALQVKYHAQRMAFLEQAGWQLLVVAAGAPLFPQGFDPLNVQRLSAREVLHSRFVKLGSDAGSIEVIGRASLSEAAGDHPLFSGVRTFRITGMTNEPVITIANGVLSIQASGVNGSFRNAVVERAEHVITIRVPQ